MAARRRLFNKQECGGSEESACLLRELDHGESGGMKKLKRCGVTYGRQARARRRAYGLPSSNAAMKITNACGSGSANKCA